MQDHQSSTVHECMQQMESGDGQAAGHEASIAVFHARSRQKQHLMRGPQWSHWKNLNPHHQSSDYRNIESPSKKSFIPSDILFLKPYVPSILHKNTYTPRECSGVQLWPSSHNTDEPQKTWQRISCGPEPCILGWEYPKRLKAAGVKALKAIMADVKSHLKKNK